MDRSSTVARFIQRFREATPRSPDRRRRDRESMEGEFWWTRSRKDTYFEADSVGCGTAPTPRTPGNHVSAYDLNEDRPRTQKPHSLELHQGEALEGSCEVLWIHDKPGESESECQHLVLDQTMLALLPLSPSSPGPPGPPLPDNANEEQTAGKPPVLELAEQVDQHVVSKSLSLLSDCSVGSSEGHGDGISRLDARACTLLDHCRQLLGAPSTISGQTAMGTQPNPISSGGGQRAVADMVGDLSHSHEDWEQRAWMLLESSESPHHGAPPNLNVGVTSTSASDLLHDQPREDIPVWERSLAREEQVGLARVTEEAVVPMNAGASSACSPDRAEHAMRGEERRDFRNLYLGTLPPSAKPLVVEVAGEVMSQRNYADRLEGTQGHEAASPGGNEDCDVSIVAAAIEDFPTRMESPIVEQNTVGKMHPGSDSNSGRVHAANYADAAGCIRTMITPAAFPQTVLSEEAAPSATLWGSARGQDLPGVAWSEEFAEDSVVLALLQRAHRIEAEFERRGSLRY